MSFTVPDDQIEAASALARFSRHPASRAVAALLPAGPSKVENVREVPGNGIEGTIDGRALQAGPQVLDRRQRRAGPARPKHGCPSDGRVLGAFRISDSLRPGAGAAVRRLRDLGVGIEILSGDAEAEVMRTARSGGRESGGRRDAASRQGGAARSASRRGSQGADGGRRPQRRPRARRGSRVDGSFLRRGRGAQRGRPRVPRLQPRKRPASNRHRAQGPAARQAEHRALDRLQRACPSACRRRPRHAAAGGHRHVDIVDPGRRQRAAALGSGRRSATAARPTSPMHLAEAA